MSSDDRPTSHSLELVAGLCKQSPRFVVALHASLEKYRTVSQTPFTGVKPPLGKNGFDKHTFLYSFEEKNACFETNPHLERIELRRWKNKITV